MSEPANAQSGSEKSLPSQQTQAQVADKGCHSPPVPPPEPEGSTEPGKSGSWSYFRVLTYNDGLGWLMNGVAVVAAVASGTMLPLMDIVFGQFVTVFNDFAIGALSPEDYRKEVNKATLWFLYLFVGKFVLVYIWTVLFSITATQTTKRLRIAFLQQTLRQEISYFDSAEAGSVAGQITTTANLVNQGIAERLGLTIQAVSTFVSAFIIAFAVQWKLTLIILCIVPAILIVTWICVAIDIKNENKLLAIFARAGLLAEDVLSSIRTVHAFWAFSGLSSRYEAILEEARKVGLKKSPNYAVLFSVEFFCVFAGYGLAFWQGIHMYQRGEISKPGTIVTVIFAVIVAAQALTQIAPQMITVSKASAAAQELFRVIDRHSRIDSLSEGGAKPDSCGGAIELRGVTFAYPSRPDVPVLKSLDLSFPSQRTTAIVGASGSGKSTIVGLLERWFDPGSGAVTLDGKELSSYNIHWLRTKIRLVQQEPTLFNGTILENVLFGLSGPEFANLTQKEKETLAEEACMSAYAHDFITELPRGYHTKIGERGAMLSGGQKQRIAIARSIISNPTVLLLDEATSALDPRAEKIVQRALDNVAVGRTMVVIAHRLSTVRNASNIVVLSGGSVVEQGTHEQLLDAGGAYANLVKAQDLGQQEDEGEASDKIERADIAALTKSRSVPRDDTTEPRPHCDPDKCPNIGLFMTVVKITREQTTLRGSIAFVALACLMGGATYPGLAIVFSRTMEAFSLTGDEMTARGDFWALMFFVIALGNIVAYGLCGWFMNIIAQHVIKRYRLEIFNNLLRQDMAFFDEPGNTTGALAARLSSEPTHLQELISFNIGLIGINVVNVVASSALAIAYGWKLGLVLALGALPPLVFSGYLRIRLEFKLDDEKSARFADSAGIASEAVLAIRTVASLALEREIVEKVRQSLHHIAAKSLASLGWTMLWYSLSQSISFLAMALGFWYGGQLVSTGEYSAVQFYVVFIAVIFSGEAAAMFFQYTTSMTKAQAAANYIFGLRAQVPPYMADEGDRGGEKGRATGGVAVECKNLEFAYPQRPDTKVLRDVSTHIQPGQFVAFVGASGCGKTTMINLLERFYDPTSGSMLYDGVDSRSIHLERYRSTIALVQQEPFLYQGSIRENIALGIGDRSASTTAEQSVADEEILQACRQANIDGFLASLPEGLATSCGRQGLQLSGGQRQRIAIARALVRKPRLLLLDEATSSLDTESERVVQAALDAAAKGEGRHGGDGDDGDDVGGRLRTTVAVAHRLSTIKAADVIFVFARGKIVESGSHEALLERRGVYYDMCLGQSLDRAPGS